MPAPDLGPDKQRALTEADAAVHRFCALLRSVRDPDVPAVGHWTVRDVAVHVPASMDLYAAILAGAPSPAATIDAVPDMNERPVRALAERDPEVLAGSIEVAAARHLAAARRCTGNPQVRWHAEVPLPLTSLLALTIGEIMVHGYDIAQATGLRWPMPAAWAHTVLRGLLPVLPSYLDVDRAANVRARFDIRLRGERGTRMSLTVAQGRLTVGPAPGLDRADCYLSADPVAFILVLYGRRSPAGQAATGRVLAWGRKPWLGFTMPSLFRRP